MERRRPAGLGLLGGCRYVAEEGAIEPAEIQGEKKGDVMMHEPLCPRECEKTAKVTLMQGERFGRNKGDYVGIVCAIDGPGLEAQQNIGGPFVIQGQGGPADLMSKDWVDIPITQEDRPACFGLTPSVWCSINSYVKQ
jgi:hypothetical protein